MGNRGFLYIMLIISCGVFIFSLITFLFPDIIAFKIMSEKLPPTAVLDNPWDKSNLSVYVDTADLSVDDFLIYRHNTLIATRWWEREGAQRLGYRINFTMTDDPESANISINWRLDDYTTNEKIRGHTYINTSNHAGDLTCDTYNSPFTICNISIRRGLDDAEMQKVITHEIGHTYTLKHSFNEADFKVRKFGINYLNSPSDIMFDDTVFEDTVKVEDFIRRLSIYGILISIAILGGLAIFATKTN